MPKAFKHATLAPATAHFDPGKSTAHPSKTKKQTSWEEESSNDYPIHLTQVVVLVPIDFMKQPIVDHDQLEAGLPQIIIPQVDPAHNLVKECTPPAVTVKPTKPLTPSKETKDPFAVQAPSTPMTHEEILKALGASIESTYPRLFPEEEEDTPPPKELSYSPLFLTLNDPPEPEGLSYYANCMPQAPPSRIVKGKRAKLTEEEKIRRLNLGLCMYYGAKGHIAKNCLELSKQQKKIAELATSALNH
ncbi:hypothetical protein FRB99_008242 [Tulasnella sp. 403]|nr:hypothetical protein FRB99_008242 [Tulasnella sp. 403]